MTQKITQNPEPGLRSIRSFGPYLKCYFVPKYESTFKDSNIKAIYNVNFTIFFRNPENRLFGHDIADTKLNGPNNECLV